VNGGRRPGRKAGTSEHQPPQLHVNKGSASGSFSRTPPIKAHEKFQCNLHGLNYTAKKQTYRKIIPDPALPLLEHCVSRETSGVLDVGFLLIFPET